MNSRDKNQVRESVNKCDDTVTSTVVVLVENCPYAQEVTDCYGVVFIFPLAGVKTNALAWCVNCYWYNWFLPAEWQDIVLCS